MGKIYVNLVVFVDRSEGKTLRHDVPERQHCRSAGAPRGGLWSMVDLGTLVNPVPLAWRTLVFG